jgi:hypothetical protein
MTGASRRPEAGRIRRHGTRARRAALSCALLALAGCGAAMPESGEAAAPIVRGPL